MCARQWQVVIISGEATVPAGHAYSSVKGGSHAGKKITTATLSHGLPVCGPCEERIKPLIAAIILAIVHLEANHTLISLHSQQTRQKKLKISNCITKNACLTKVSVLSSQWWSFTGVIIVQFPFK